MRLVIMNLRLWTNGILCAGFFYLSGCHWNNSGIEAKTLVRVNSHELSVKQFSDDLVQRLSKYDALTAKEPKTIERVKSAVISDFTMNSILRDWAFKNNLSVTKEDIEAETQKIRSGFPDDFAFREELSKQGLSINQWQLNIQNRLIEKEALTQLQSKVPEPTEAEILRFYDSNKTRYRENEKILLQQIVLAENSDADRIQAALKEKKSFEALAKQFSITPESKKGGLVGWVEKGTLEVFDKAFTLPQGKISETIQSPYGFHIMLVQKRAPGGVTPLTSVRGAIKRELKAKREQAFFSTWLEQQVRSANVFKDQKTIDQLGVDTRQD